MYKIQDFQVIRYKHTNNYLEEPYPRYLEDTSSAFRRWYNRIFDVQILIEDISIRTLTKKTISVNFANKFHSNN